MDMRVLLEIYEESFWRFSTSGTSYYIILVRQDYPDLNLEFF